MFSRINLFIILTVCSAPLKGQENPPETQAKSGSPFDQSKFVPDISLITDFSYVARDLKNDQFSALGLPGFGTPLDLSGNQGNSLTGSNTRRGFNFNYGEMTFYSIADPYFDLFADLHLTSDHAGLEEAYMTTRKLPYGFRVKAGKFLSGIGRLNDQHEHAWDFADRPLVAQAFLGEEGLNEIGGQITWVAPIDVYLMLGAEILNGDNEASFGTVGFMYPGTSVHVQETNGPGLFVNFVRSAFDWGDATFLIGLSSAHGITRTDHGFSDAAGGGSAFDGTSDLANGNVTAKYILDPIRSISFQGEYFYRLMDGKIYNRDSLNTIHENTLNKHQAGLYAQLTAKIDLRWRIAVRYDLIHLNDVFLQAVNNNLPKKLARYSAMVEFNPTEFSRLRLQFNSDMSKYLQIRIHERYSEVILQLNMAIGAHGAHPF
jgi:hypothetical protein